MEGQRCLYIDAWIVGLSSKFGTRTILMESHRQVWTLATTYSTYLATSAGPKEIPCLYCTCVPSVPT